MSEDMYSRRIHDNIPSEPPDVPRLDQATLDVDHAVTSADGLVTAVVNGPTQQVISVVVGRLDDLGWVRRPSKPSTRRSIWLAGSRVWTTASPPGWWPSTRRWSASRAAWRTSQVISTGCSRPSSETPRSAPAWIDGTIRISILDRGRKSAPGPFGADGVSKRGSPALHGPSRAPPKASDGRPRDSNGWPTHVCADEAALAGLVQLQRPGAGLFSATSTAVLPDCTAPTTSWPAWTVSETPLELSTGVRTPAGKLPPDVPRPSQPRPDGSHDC